MTDYPSTILDLLLRIANPARDFLVGLRVGKEPVDALLLLPSGRKSPIPFSVFAFIPSEMSASVLIDADSPAYLKRRASDGKNGRRHTALVTALGALAPVVRTQPIVDILLGATFCRGALRASLRDSDAPGSVRIHVRRISADLPYTPAENALLAEVARFVAPTLAPGERTLVAAPPHVLAMLSAHERLSLLDRIESLPSHLRGELARRSARPDDPSDRHPSLVVRRDDPYALLIATDENPANDSKLMAIVPLDATENAPGHASWTRVLKPSLALSRSP